METGSLKNVACYIMAKIESYGDKIAQIDNETGATMTYRQIYCKIKQFAEYLIVKGVKRGDIICLCIQNTVDYCWLLLGPLYIGAICVLIGPGIKSRELEHFLQMTGPKWFIGCGLMAEQQTIIDNFKSIILTMKTEDIKLPDEFSNCNTGSHCYYDADSTAIILSSSGSTGLPKGVMLTHGNIIAVLKSSANYISGDDTYLGMLPFYHALGLLVLLHGLCEGSEVVTMATFKYGTFITNIFKYQVTVLFLVPSLLVSLCKNCEVSKELSKSVKRICTGAAKINPKIQDAMLKRFPQIELYHSYGMTETCFVTFWGKYRVDKPGSCGQLVNNCKCKIISVNGNTLKCGELGELCFKGPMIMKGYLNNIKATEEAIDENGWLHSGDMGYFDEDGYYFITERIKEIIKYQGFQISPSEIESVLLTHKGVSEAAVVGVPNPLYGELPRAYIVKADPNVTEKDLIKLVEAELSSYKQLRAGVHFVDSLPKTLSGKILRREVKKNNEIEN